MFKAEILKISEFFSENFQFLVVKFSIYLNMRVFVMRGRVGGLDTLYSFYATCYKGKKNKLCDFLFAVLYINYEKSLF